MVAHHDLGGAAPSTWWRIVPGRGTDKAAITERRRREFGEPYYYDEFSGEVPT